MWMVALGNSVTGARRFGSDEPVDSDVNGISFLDHADLGENIILIIPLLNAQLTLEQNFGMMRLETHVCAVLDSAQTLGMES